MECPCKGCEFRNVGCHSTCEPYKDWKGEQNDILEQKKKEQKMRDLLFRKRR